MLEVRKDCNKEKQSPQNTSKRVENASLIWMGKAFSTFFWLFSTLAYDCGLKLPRVEKKEVGVSYGLDYDKILWKPVFIQTLWYYFSCMKWSHISKTMNSNNPISDLLSFFLIYSYMFLLNDIFPGRTKLQWFSLRITQILTNDWFIGYLFWESWHFKKLK